MSAQALDPAAILVKVKQMLTANGLRQYRMVSKFFQDPDKPTTIEIDRQRFYTGLNELGVTLSKYETEALFNFLDSNGNFKVSLEEFLNGIRKPLSKKRLDLVEAAFKKYDKNGNGYLEVSELKYSVKQGNIQSGEAPTSAEW